MEIIRSLFYQLLLVICFSLLNTSLATCATLSDKSKDSVKAQQLLKTGDSLKNASQYKRAINVLEKAKNILDQTDQTESYYYAINTLAKAFVRLQDFRKGRLYLEKIVDDLKDKPKRFPDKLGEAYYSLGYIYNNAPDLRSLDEAKGFYKKAISTFRFSENASENVKKVYGNLSAFYYNKSNIDSAIYFAKKAVVWPADSARTINNAQALNNLAQLYQHQGFIKKALKRYKASLSIYKAKEGENHYGTGVLYQNIGVIYKRKRNLSKARDYIKKAHNILSSTLGEHPKTADCLGNLALIDEWHGDRDKALNELYKAKAIYNKLEQEQEKSYYNILYGIARNYMGIGDYEKAFDYYEKIFQNKQKLSELKTYRYLPHLSKAYRKVGKLDSAYYYQKMYMDTISDLRGRYDHSIATGHLHLARIYEAKEDYNRALENIQKGLNSCYGDFDWNYYYENPALKDYDRWDIVFKLLNQKGQILQKFAQSGTDLDTSYLQYAHKSFCLASRLIDTIKTRYQSRNTVHTVYQHADDAYEGAIQTAFQLYKITGKRKYKKKSYPLFGKNKSVLLRKNLQKSKARNFANIPDSLVRKEAELQEIISYLQSSLHQDKSSELDNSQRKAYEKRLLNTREEFYSLKNRIRVNYPAYYQLMYKSDLHTIKELQKNILTRDKCVLEYFSGKDAYYYTFIATDTSLIGSVKKDSTFEQSLNKILQAIDDPDSKIGDFVAPSYRLYQSFLGTISYPLKNKQLHVIPDGQLAYLPFEVLIQKKPSENENHFNQLEYVVYDHNINYVYANNFLKNQEADQTSHKSKYLGVAPLFNKNEDTTRNQGVAQLEGAKQELEYLSLIGQGKKLQGRQATKDRFKDEVKDHEIIHMATHAFLESKYPMNSRLLLANSDTSSGNGKLYAWELFNMDIDAELAVLSACNSGRGKMINGEGVMSLGRAFTYAGCPSLVISLWNVHDQVSVELMKEFYRSLDQGMGKNEALRQSKLNYLASADGITAHPYYWAGMITMGDNSPVKEAAFLSGNGIIYSFLAILLLILAGGGLYYRKFS